jgi:hypothetical protein
MDTTAPFRSFSLSPNSSLFKASSPFWMPWAKVSKLIYFSSFHRQGFPVVLSLAIIHSSILCPDCTRKFWWHLLFPKPIEASFYWHMCSICGPKKFRESCLCHFKHGDALLPMGLLEWVLTYFFVKDGTSNFNKGMEELHVGLLDQYQYSSQSPSKLNIPLTFCQFSMWQWKEHSSK